MALLGSSLFAFRTPINTFPRTNHPLVVTCVQQPAILSSNATPTTISTVELSKLGKPKPAPGTTTKPAVVESDKSVDSVTDPSQFNHNSFPPDFVFGTASAAYQYEGAVREGGRGPSIWDIFCNKYPERIADGSNGNVAVDFYRFYRDDLQLMKDVGVKAFRFSISWSRILPRGSLKGGINKKGVDFYNNLIDEIIAHGLQPYVTLFHWDFPHALEDEYGGFLSSRCVDDFKDYAEVCYQLFGDRVKHWITLNEPWTVAQLGYDAGTIAPGRCSKWVNSACQAGNSATEPYTVTHNMLLCHAAAVKVFREKYQAIQKGQIGITIVTQWMVPYDESDPNDVDAAQRALDFFFGWYMDPIVFGNYPQCMRDLVRERLPRFTPEQSEMLKGSYDFIGLNYYTARFAKNVPTGSEPSKLRYITDWRADILTDRDGVPIGPLGPSTWVYSYPRGLNELLKYTKEHYNNPSIYITENGTEQALYTDMPLKEILGDDARERFHSEHLWEVKKAIDESEVDVKGYFLWSFLDNFEWQSGYTSRFGIYYVDFKNDLARYPKQSALWFKKFLNA